MCDVCRFCPLFGKERLVSLHFTDYNTAGDEQLAFLIQQDDQRAFAEILSRYRGLILNKVSKLSRSGLDMDDLVQECSLGLLDAAKGYDTRRGASLRTFASICIDNRLRSVIRRSASERNRPMNDYVELTDEVRSDDSTANPETMLLIREDAAEQHKYIEKILSKSEYAVFTKYIAGLSYEEIAAELGISVKSVDNALTRMRRKLRGAQ